MAVKRPFRRPPAPPAGTVAINHGSEAVEVDGVTVPAGEVVVI